MFIGETESRDLQYLFLIYIRAWYVETPQQPPPPGVLQNLAAEDEPAGAEEVEEDFES